MFVITTNPDNFGKTWTHPLWWTGSGVRGPVETNEARYADRTAAEAAFAAIPERTRAFYDLAVVGAR